MTGILSAVQLEALKHRKYCSEGSTLLEPVMQKFWGWLLERTPLWLAPNVITLVGLACNVFTTHLLLWYDSDDAVSGVPQWLFLLAGFSLFVYQCLDALDGKQARRTNSASPLGELFDHGGDAISMVYIIVGVSSCLSLASYPRILLCVNLTFMFLFYTAHWQTYCSGRFRFRMFEFMECQFLIMLIYMLTAIFGADMWRDEVPVLGDWPIMMIPVVLSIPPFLMACYTYFTMIFAQGGGVAKKTGGSTTVAGTTSMPASIVPIGLHITLALSTASHSDANVLENHPALFIFTWGMIFTKITCKLIVAYMSRCEQIELLDTAFLGPLLLLLTQHFKLPLPEHLVLWVAYIYATTDLLVYLTRVSIQICDHLNIRCFQIGEVEPNKTTRPHSSNTTPRPQSHSTESVTQSASNK